MNEVTVWEVDKKYFFSFISKEINRFYMYFNLVIS